MDEHHSKLIGHKVYIATTVGDKLFLGAAISPGVHYEDLAKAYGTFKQEATQVYPDYRIATINIDGFSSTKKTVNTLFKEAKILRCFLHGFLKIRNCGTKAYELYFSAVSQRVWNCYHAKTKREFAQRIQSLREFSELIPESPFKDSILTQVVSFHRKNP